MSIETNTAISRQWHESFGTPHLKSAYEKFLAEDFKALFFGHGWVDRDAYIKGDQEFVAAFDDVTMSVEQAVGEGDLVMCRMRWRGRQIAPVMGVARCGSPTEIMRTQMSASDAVSSRPDKVRPALGPVTIATLGMPVIRRA